MLCAVLAAMLLATCGQGAASETVSSEVSSAGVSSSTVASSAGGDSSVAVPAQVITAEDVANGYYDVEKKEYVWPDPLPAYMQNAEDWQLEYWRVFMETEGVSHFYLIFPEEKKPVLVLEHGEPAEISMWKIQDGEAFLEHSRYVPERRNVFTDVIYNPILESLVTFYRYDVGAYDIGILCYDNKFGLLENDGELVGDGFSYYINGSSFGWTGLIQPRFDFLIKGMTSTSLRKTLQDILFDTYELNLPEEAPAWIAEYNRFFYEQFKEQYYMPTRIELMAPLEPGGPPSLCVNYEEYYLITVNGVERFYGGQHGSCQLYQSGWRYSI